MLDFCLRGLVRAIDAAPRIIAVTCLTLTAVATIIVARIPLTADILDVMPEKNPAIVAFTDFLRDFGILNGLIVVVESPEPAREALMATVQDLGERLSASSFVASVDYNLLHSGARFAAEHFPLYLDADGMARLAERLSPEGIRGQMRRNREVLLSPFSSPFDAEMIGRDPLAIRELVRSGLIRRLPARSLDVSAGYYLDASHRLAFLMVRPRGSARDMAFVRGLHREIGDLARRAVASAGEGQTVRVRMAGGYARAAEALGIIWRDMLVSFAVSFVSVLAMLYAAFRPSVTVLAIFVLTLFASLAWTLALAYALYGALNIITSIVAAMLIGLFVDYIIHTFRRFEDSFRRDGSASVALERTLTGTGKAILSGALTTSLSFFAVVVTSFRGLHELGVVAGFGILFCLLATLVLMLSLLVWLARSRPAHLRAGRPADLGGHWAARWVQRRPAVALVGFAALVVGGVGGATALRFDASLESVGLRESAVQEVEGRIAQVIGRQGDPLFVVARSADEARLSGDFDALERTAERWRVAGVVGGVSSLGTLLPAPARQRAAMANLDALGLPGRLTGRELAATLRAEMDRQGLVADAAIDRYADAIEQALARREVVGPREYAQAGDPRAAHYYNPAARALAAHVSPPASGWTPDLLSRLGADVRGLGAAFRLVGPALFLVEIRDTILWEAGLAVALSFLANLLVLRMHFLQWRRVWLVMLPVTAGTVLTVGAMGTLGMPFNFFNVAGIALIFGFGVDYGIYFMQAFVESPAGPERVANTLRTVGGSIVLCAATTLASCGSLITSHYRGLASIGAVLCLGALACLAATLFLLPSVLERRHASEIAP
jgi:predicted RND superfamily exporter protein